MCYMQYVSMSVCVHVHVCVMYVCVCVINQRIVPEKARSINVIERP